MAPRREAALLAPLPVASGAIATSGDYERFIEVAGVRHFHVLDPRSGKAARGFHAGTGPCAGCLVGGGAPHLALLKGATAGLEWLRSLGLGHLCVLEDGTIIDATAEESIPKT